MVHTLLLPIFVLIYVFLFCRGTQGDSNTLSFFARQNGLALLSVETTNTSNYGDTPNRAFFFVVGNDVSLGVLCVVIFEFVVMNLSKSFSYEYYILIIRHTDDIVAHVEFQLGTKTNPFFHKSFRHCRTYSLLHPLTFGIISLYYLWYGLTIRL